MSEQPRSDALAVFRVGAFSGSARSLLTALGERTWVDDHDLMSLTREPRLLVHRGSAHLAARRAGVPWVKTERWSAAVQAWCERRGWLRPGLDAVFIQTIPAFILDPAIRYVVYTDRVALEGADAEAGFASRFSPGWLDREREFLQRAAMVFVMGPSTKLWLERSYGIPSTKISVVGAGPNANPPEPRLGGKCRRLTFVGTQWRLKGGPEVVAAFEEARRVRPDLELAVIGSDPGHPMPEGVKVIGRVSADGVSAALRNTDLFVVVGHLEAFGIALMEALMSGIPAIGSTVGNQEWLIGDAGIVVDPGDVEALSKAILAISDNYEVYKSAALNRGRELRMTMSWGNVTAAILDALGTSG